MGVERFIEQCFLPRCKKAIRSETSQIIASVSSSFIDSIIRRPTIYTLFYLTGARISPRSWVPFPSMKTMEFSSTKITGKIDRILSDQLRVLPLNSSKTFPGRTPSFPAKRKVSQLSGAVQRGAVKISSRPRRGRTQITGLHYTAIYAYGR